MRKVLMVSMMVLAVLLASCKNGSKTSEKCCAEKQEVASTVLAPEDVLKDGANLVGKSVEITGTVTHICKHGGKKCSIMGNTPEAAVQIMATGEIQAFPADVMGTNILVQGVVKERQISKEIITEQETAMKAKAEQAESEEGKKHCSHSMHNLDKMKQWMADNGKEYYPVFFIEGTNYKIVE